MKISVAILSLFLIRNFYMKSSKIREVPKLEKSILNWGIIMIKRYYDWPLN